jgi:hypothetical protein
MFDALKKLPESLPDAYSKVIGQMSLYQKDMAFGIMSRIFTLAGSPEPPASDIQTLPGY